MNKEQLEEALKTVKEPITVNSIEYKYFDIENYNKLVQAIDYCNYLNANVKPYVEAQDKEIERLNNIINELEKYLRKVRQITFDKYNSNEWNNCLSFNDDIKPILDKLKELKEGDNND